MTRALAGRSNDEFDVPDGISFVDIDPASGKLATPACSRTFREAFRVGTEPLKQCDLHR
jgi:membrane carboxypeptidase/penicillin-binding protein